MEQLSLEPSLLGRGLCSRKHPLSVWASTEASTSSLLVLWWENGAYLSMGVQSRAVEMLLLFCGTEGCVQSDGDSSGEHWKFRKGPRKINKMPYGLTGLPFGEKHRQVYLAYQAEGED